MNPRKSSEAHAISGCVATLATVTWTAVEEDMGRKDEVHRPANAKQNSGSWAPPIDHATWYCYGPCRLIRVA